MKDPTLISKYYKEERERKRKQAQILGKHISQMINEKFVNKKLPDESIVFGIDCPNGRCEM